MVLVTCEINVLNGEWVQKTSVATKCKIAKQNPTYIYLADKDLSQFSILAQRVIKTHEMYLVFVCMEAVRRIVRDSRKHKEVVDYEMIRLV